MDRSAIDLKMMRRCVELSADAVRRQELPFACVICRDGEVVAEAINRVVQDADVTRHAEIIAISEAQRILGRSDLSDCTIYSNVEPCPMCSFPIRETRIGRVVYAISSPMMGGFSKWNVLGDNEISNVMPEVFGDKPEVAAGLLLPRGCRGVAKVESGVLARHSLPRLPCRSGAGRRRRDAAGPA